MKMTFLTAILIRKELGRQHQPTAVQKGGLTLAYFLPRWPSMFWHVWILKIALNYVWNQNETITVSQIVNFQSNPKLFYQVRQSRYSMRIMAIWCTRALCGSCCEGEIWASTPLEAYPEAVLQPQNDYICFSIRFFGVESKYDLLQLMKGLSAFRVITSYIMLYLHMSICMHL